MENVRTTCILWKSFVQARFLLANETSVTEKRFCLMHMDAAHLHLLVLKMFAWMLSHYKRGISRQVDSHSFLSFKSSQDVYIHRFLKNCHQVENRHLPVSPSRSNDCNLETGLKKSVSDLRAAQPEPLVRFLPIVLEKLIMLLVRPPVVSGHVGKSLLCIFNALKIPNQIRLVNFSA